MLGIISGFIMLIFSFYVLYMGSVMDNNWITFLGVAMGIGSGIFIAISRLKLNIKTLDTYKATLNRLAEHPNDETLKEMAYNAGVHFYKNKRDNKIILPMDIHAINRDIDQAMKNKI